MAYKRFAFVIADLYGGGAQKVLLNTAEGLRQRGHTVRVFMLRDVIEHELPAGLDIVNLALINKVTKAVSNVALEKYQAQRIRKALEAYGPDSIISCSCDKITRHIKHPRLYFWIHANSIAGLPPEAPEARKKIKKLQRFYHARHLITVSQGIKASLHDLAGLLPDRMRVIYNPFDQDAIRLAASEEKALPHAPRSYFLHVGTFEPRKRHDRLLKAYAASHASSPLVILGKGKANEKQAIQQQIDELGLSESVTMLDYQSNPYPLIANAKALVLTSDREGLPTVLIEALLLHTPVISVDCPSGPREILTQEFAEFLVAPDDAAGLAEAIARMDRDPVVVEPRHYQPFLKETVLPQFEAL
ncbi:MAG: glycosyltransferase [Halomonas subglaciescola]|nr:glycosyltransferase [Halomonas subglaciescola]